MEEEAIDEYSQRAIDVGLEDLLDDSFNQEEEETVVEEPVDEEEEYNWDEDPDDIDLDIEDISDEEIKELSKFSPANANRVYNLKAGSGALETYLKHQQGQGGYRQIMSGNISKQVMSNMRNNLPSNLRNVPDSKLRDTFVGHWRNKLGNTTISANPNVVQEIKRAAEELGEDGDKWLKIIQVESNFNPKAVSPSGRHHGYYQIDRSYVNNPSLLADPYQATKIAIRHNRNQFKNGKLDYDLGQSGYLNKTINLQPISSLGYTPTGGVPYSNQDSYFGGAKLNNDFPTSTEFKLSSLDPTGASQTLKMIDSVGSGVVDAISGAMSGYKQMKGLIGQGVDSAVTGISSILSEKQQQRDYNDMLKKLYGEGNYIEKPLDMLLKSREGL